jgi:hypothetical protein
MRQFRHALVIDIACTQLFTLDSASLNWVPPGYIIIVESMTASTLSQKYIEQANLTE